MAWQKRSSGNKHDSNTGHAVLVESATRKVIAFIMKTKLCSVCLGHKRKKDDTQPVREHKCNVNHHGSAGSMEPQAILEMVVDLYDNRCSFAKFVITDDDSSIKAKCKWNNEDWMLNNNTTTAPKVLTRHGKETHRPNRGELPRHVPEPEFLADPNHRKKTLKGVLYKHLKTKTKERCGLTRCDVMRVTTNFCYMVRSLQQCTTDEQILNAGKAVVEHHFDNHEHCGSFCKRKAMTTEERQEQQKPYRDKEKHAELHNCLTLAIARFVSLPSLREVQHGSDTLLNESLNNTIAWLAPKNKTCGSTQSLLNRIAIAICISTLGTRECFDRLFVKLGIAATPDILCHLDKQQRTRSHRIETYKKALSKLKRNKKFHALLKKHTEEAKKKDGFYEPGVGMDGGHAEGETAAATRPTKATVICPCCKKKGHKTTRSKFCDYFEGKSNAANAATTCADVDVVEFQAMMDGDEQELLDQLPLDEDNKELFDCLEEADNDSDDDDDDDDKDVESGIL